MALLLRILFMTITSHKKFVVPEYMTHFECVGKDCIDSCCVGWNIHIDKKTFKKYENSKNNTVKSISNKYLVKDNENSEIAYGKLQNLNNSCPFLNEEKLCKAYDLLGKDSLSVTCSTYPRIIKNFKNFGFIAGEMSCPEVARLCINNNNLKIEKLSREKIPNIFNSKNIHSSELSKKVTDKTIKFVEKVLFEFKKNKSFFEIAGEILKIHSKVFRQNKFFFNYMESDCKQIKNQNLLIKIKILPTLLFSHFAKNSRYGELCKKAADKSGFFKKSENEFKQDFFNIHDNKVNKFLKKNDFIMKNFFINEFLKNVEKIESSETSFEYLIREIFCLFDLSNFLVICNMFDNQDKLTVDNYISTISAVTKKIQSSKNNINLVVEFFKKMDNNNLFKRLADFHY